MSSIPVNLLNDLFAEQVSKQNITIGGKPVVVKLDRYESLLNGGMILTVSLRPQTTKRVDPFKAGTRFIIGRRTYEVLGMNARSWKFSVSCKRIPDGRRFKVKPQSVLDGFISE